MVNANSSTPSEAAEVRSSSSAACRGPSGASETIPPGPPTANSSGSAPVKQKPSGIRKARHSCRPATPAGPRSTARVAAATSGPPGHGGRHTAVTVSPIPSRAFSSGWRWRQRLLCAAASIGSTGYDSVADVDADAAAAASAPWRRPLRTPK